MSQNHGYNHTTLNFLGDGDCVFPLPAPLFCLRFKVVRVYVIMSCSPAHEFFLVFLKSLQKVPVNIRLFLFSSDLDDTFLMCWSSLRMTCMTQCWCSLFRTSAWLIFYHLWPSYAVVVMVAPSSVLVLLQINADVHFFFLPCEIVFKCCHHTLVEFFGGQPFIKKVSDHHSDFFLMFFSNFEWLNFNTSSYKFCKIKKRLLTRNV